MITNGRSCDPITMPCCAPFAILPAVPTQVPRDMVFGLKFYFFVVFELLLSVPVLCMMSSLEEERTMVKFLSKSGHAPMESWRQMRQVYNDQTITPKMIRVWSKKFEAGVDSVKDKPCSGQPRSARIQANIDTVRQVIQGDRRTSISDICEETKLKKTTVHSIIKKDLKFSKLAPKFVPKLLTDEQKCFRVQMCELNLESLRQDDSFIDKIITGDESWVSIFELELKQNSREWHPSGSLTCPS